MIYNACMSLNAIKQVICKTNIKVGLRCPDTVDALVLLPKSLFIKKSVNRKETNNLDEWK